MRCQQGNESDESLSYLEEETRNAVDEAIEEAEAEAAAEAQALEEEFFQDED